MSPAKPKTKGRIPYDFILEALEPAAPEIKPMFGHTCVYVGEKIVLFLIEKPGNPDNGICLATSGEHIESLRRDFPSLRHLKAYGAEATDWRLLPSGSVDFEEAALKACRLILREDPRIGRIPKGRKKVKG